MSVAGVPDFINEQFEGDAAHFRARLADGGDRNHMVGGEVVIVVADDCHVPGNGDSGKKQGLGASCSECIGCREEDRKSVV